MTDRNLTDRLRAIVARDIPNDDERETMIEAADEIDRLRAEVARLCGERPPPPQFPPAPVPLVEVLRDDRGIHEGHTVDVGYVHVGAQAPGQPWQCALTCPHPDHGDAE